MIQRISFLEKTDTMGARHGLCGEGVSAFVKLKKGQMGSEDALIRLCKERTASCKAPKEIIFVEDLPKTREGKLLKREQRGFSAGLFFAVGVRADHGALSPKM